MLIAFDPFAKPGRDLLEIRGHGVRQVLLSAAPWRLPPASNDRVFDDAAQVLQALPLWVCKNSRMKNTGFTEGDAADLYRGLEALGIEIWIDGGWGVDALLGRQTRDHGDLDIVVQEGDLPALRRFLAGQGYEPLARDDTRPWNFVLGDGAGREVDVHVIVLDANGDGIYGPPQNGDIYPAAALRARGRIDGLPVRCLSPECQLDSHSGYPLREIDHQDMRALAEKYGLELPEAYRER